MIVPSSTGLRDDHLDLDETQMLRHETVYADYFENTLSGDSEEFIARSENHSYLLHFQRLMKQVVRLLIDFRDVFYVQEMCIKD